jgi:D-alanine-D-alanine ligase
MGDPKDEGNIFQYLKSKIFLKQILFLGGAVFLLLFLIQLWLRFYTNHGQKLELPKFVGMDLASASELADDKSFELVVIDSIFIVGKKGGLITDQNPKSGSLVKENRKIYITITKYNTETIKVADLPTLYGNAFDQKKTELKYREIECVIKDYAYDPGEPNHILEVYYKGELIISKDGRKEDVVIDKGGILECIVSRKDGGDVTIPDLRCMEVEEAKFLLESSKLELGDILKRGNAEPDATLYVIAQSPPYDGISNVKMGDKISITVAPTKPMDCN